MVFVTWQLQRSPFASNAWGSPVTLTGYHDPLIRVSLGDTRDNFSFKVTNFNGDFDNYFQPNDKITFSRVINSTTFSSSNILMVGTVTDAPETLAANQATIEVQGYNFSETVAQVVVFIDATNLTIPQALQTALNHVRAYNSNFAVTWNSGNPSVRSDGTAFPLVQERFFNRPFRDIIEKYSTQQATGDSKPYYWYIDNNNTLVWRLASGTISTTFNSSTDKCKQLKIGKDIKDVINFVIVKGGLDPESKPIQDRYLDMVSIAKNGQKFQYIPDITGNAGTLHKQDCDKAVVKHMRDAAYPFTTTWVSLVTGAVVVCDGYKTGSTPYIDALRAHIKARCRAEGKRVVENTKYGKLQLTITFGPGQKTWGLGDLINCTVTQLSTSAKQLRVYTIEYSTTTDTFTLQEDIGTV